MRCPACGFQNISGEDECANCMAPLAGEEISRPKAGLERRILEGNVAVLVRGKAVSVSATDTVSKAIDEMRRKKVGCVLVVHGESLDGLLSEREILFSGVKPSDFGRMRVSDLMRKRLCLRDEDPIADAFHHMAVSGYRHLPVRLRDGSYGVVSARDLLRFLCR